MLGWEQLKTQIRVTASSVECPVRDCAQVVKRQRQRFQRNDEFLCPQHGIFISPSTFEYQSESDNMLWATDDDLALWRCINAPGMKRESRVTRDNSEDAVTWNVFRFLEKCGLLGHFINMIGGEPLAVLPRIIYWSYCQSSHLGWQPLANAASVFGESVERRSEPDLVIDDDRLLVFVENKFLSTNRTRPSMSWCSKRYTTGGDGWFSNVFALFSDFQSIAVADELYQLMRLWLIGSWIADQQNKAFVLINVLRSQDKEEANIEARFGKHIQTSPRRRFVRLTWEAIRNDLVAKASLSLDKERLTTWFRNKTAGYDRNGWLRRAFSS